MSLILTATEAGLAQRIRNRIADGAAIREITDLPTWVATQIGDAAVQAVFQSAHAHVAVLANGRTVVRRVQG